VRLRLGSPLVWTLGTEWPGNHPWQKGPSRIVCLKPFSIYFFFYLTERIIKFVAGQSFVGHQGFKCLCLRKLHDSPGFVSDSNQMRRLANVSELIWISDANSSYEEYEIPFHPTKCCCCPVCIQLETKITDCW